VALAAQRHARQLGDRQSKLTLEGLLGHPVRDFAYPYGSFNSYDLAQAKSLGFRDRGLDAARRLARRAQLYELSRVRVGGGLRLNLLRWFAGRSARRPPSSV